MQRVESQDKLCPTLDTRCDTLGVVVANDIKPSVRENYVRDKDKIAQSDKDIFMCDCTSGFNDNKVGIKLSPTIRAGNSHTAVYNNLLIRKLTPKECWRLMGFDDTDFEKASLVNSNSQLYKQAGNSIVVNVLEEIFKKLFGCDNYE
jgi:DNA (cytosine-5)-methyltransferase 1